MTVEMLVSRFATSQKLLMLNALHIIGLCAALREG